MTKTTITERERSLVQEGEDAFAWCRDEAAKSGPLPCWVDHPDAGGECERTAVMEVYGLPFCDVHGPEAKAGALTELYHNASEVLEHLDNPHVGADNSAALQAMRKAVSELTKQCIDAEKLDDVALPRAYPFIPERMDEDAADFDYTDPERGDSPEEWNYHSRMLICKLMRLAHEAGEIYLVEMLEHERERVSAQLAFARADYEERVKKPRA